ncbi:hypothetical protein AGLY_013836 [Aphis glycines]|uniref:Odorant receptor n=1 Tax=Aphis glycines TaxID=307491 RepID=A0A6G0T7D3_APHGL|nr:hypothetical protein AGLY_013836 [Aphis glycines]
MEKHFNSRWRQYGAQCYLWSVTIEYTQYQINNILHHSYWVIKCRGGQREDTVEPPNILINMEKPKCKKKDCIDKMEPSTMATFNDHTAAIGLKVLKQFVIILMLNKSKIQQILDVTDLKFLKSKQCRDNIKIFYKHRNKILKLTKLYFNFTVLVIIQWVFYPIIINTFILNKTDNRRLENIINRRYPVDVNTYNQYYAFYYVIETILAVISLYLVSIIDILLLPIGWGIIVQYKILAISIKNIGHNYRNRLKIGLKNFLTGPTVFAESSTKIFSKKLVTKIKLYFSMMKPIVLMHVSINAGLIMMLSTSFCMVLLSTESFTQAFVNLFKIGIGIVYLCLQLFLYCHLFDNIHLNIQSVNLGIYSCNWTNMDLKFKKLLLLTMQMNKANEIMMKVSMKKIINLQLFASVGFDDVLQHCFCHGENNWKMKTNTT